jgi:putative peptide zinc metalloprotease protein
MSTIFSSSWYRVARLTPRLRSHAHIHRHQYRGRTWYVLQDTSSDRFHRFSGPAYLVIGLMDGRRTVHEIWETATTRLGDDAPSQDEVIHLLGQLHAADVLLCDVPPDAEDLFERRQKQSRRQWQSRLLSPFSWRIPLFDPEPVLRAGRPLTRPLVSWPGALLWLAVVGPAVILAGVHWSDLTANVMDRVLAPQSLILLWLSFPLIKLAHEFGHAFMVKAFGGEVHDMGVMLLVLTPVPYVDASSSSAFRSKWQRMLVGAAGMLVELFLAALALFVWLSAEPGIVRALAYNTMIVAGISTILFNANPLLRFDGYYILADFLEIPNLRTRSTAYLVYLAERYLFGRHDAEPPEATAAERAWFVGFAVASMVYRALVVVGILAFLADRFFLLGLVFAAAAAVAWLVVPVVKASSFLFTNPRLRPVRTRALTVTAAAVALVVAGITVAPAPYRSETEGVVWIPEEAFVRPGTEGFIERVVAAPGARVRRGDVLLLLADPALAARVDALDARVRELEARYAEQNTKDRVQAEIVQEELLYARQSLARGRERIAELTVRSRADGTFVITAPENLPGRFVKQGELLAHVVDLKTLIVRAVVSQASIDLVRDHTRAVDVRLAERLTDIVPAVVRRVVPGGSERLPTNVLGSLGGGQIAVDPRDQQGVTALQKFFELDLELPARSGLVNAGGRAYVRFDHGWAPLAVQWWQQLRQLFLARFNV